MENQKPSTALSAILKQTPPTKIAELDFVRDKFISNYNYTHKDKVGELMYHRQCLFFTQAVATSADLQATDPFSLYACFVTAAVKGYSFDPQDNEVYMLPLKGRAFLWPQAGAHVRRLIQTNQILSADQPQLVYEGDEFVVENSRVTKHIRKFTSEKILAGYVRFILNEKGDDRFFIYQKSDWMAWKKKSTQQNNADTWNGGEVAGQPAAAFLRTKIMKHATREKSWSIGTTDPRTEQFAIEIEADTIEEIQTIANQPATPAPSVPAEETFTPTVEVEEIKDEAPPVTHHDEIF